MSLSTGKDQLLSLTAACKKKLLLIGRTLLAMESKMCLMAFEAMLTFKNALSRSRGRDAALQLSDTNGITECLLDQ